MNGQFYSFLKFMVNFSGIVFVKGCSFVERDLVQGRYARVYSLRYGV